MAPFFKTQNFHILIVLNLRKVDIEYMKIRMLENIEDELIVEKEKNNALIQDIKSIFIDKGFKYKSEINGISFSKNEENLIANFYIDSRNLSYDGYITSEIDNSNYELKGNKLNIFIAANTFLDVFSKKLSNTDL